MEKFPEDFCRKNMSSLKRKGVSEVIDRTRQKIVEIVRKDRDSYRDKSYFMIAYSGDVIRCSSGADLVKAREIDKTLPCAAEKVQMHECLVKTLASELNLRFGDAFKTLHVTSWDEDTYEFYPMSYVNPSCLFCVNFD